MGDGKRIVRKYEEADMEYCMRYSKELLLLDPKADFELQKTYL